MLYKQAVSDKPRALVSDFKIKHMFKHRTFRPQISHNVCGIEGGNLLVINLFRNVLFAQ